MTHSPLSHAMPLPQLASVTHDMHAPVAHEQYECGGEQSADMMQLAFAGVTHVWFALQWANEETLVQLLSVKQPTQYPALVSQYAVRALVHIASFVQGNFGGASLPPGTQDRPPPFHKSDVSASLPEKPPSAEFRLPVREAPPHPKPNPMAVAMLITAQALETDMGSILRFCRPRATTRIAARAHTAW